MCSSSVKHATQTAKFVPLQAHITSQAVRSVWMACMILHLIMNYIAFERPIVPVVCLVDQIVMSNHLKLYSSISIGR